MFVNYKNNIQMPTKPVKKDIYQTINNALNWDNLNQNVERANNPLLSGITGALQSGLSVYDAMKRNQAEDEKYAEDKAAYDDASKKRDETNAAIAQALNAGKFNTAASLSAASGDSEDAIKYSGLYNQRQADLNNMWMKRNTVSSAKQDADEEKKNKYLAHKEQGLQTLNILDDGIAALARSPYSFGDGLGSATARAFNSEGKKDYATATHAASSVFQYMQSGEGKIAASVMNSDAEGRRALGILADPTKFTADEVSAALALSQKSIKNAMARNAIANGFDPTKEVDGYIPAEEKRKSKKTTIKNEGNVIDSSAYFN